MGPGVDRLLGLFETGALVRPEAGAPNTIDLARALAVIAGAPRFRDERGVEALVSLIGAPRHLVFVLADGLGMSLVERLPPGAFLRRNLALELRAVFPSSTAPALTSLATGVWPAAHAALTWFTYLPEGGLTAVLLPFSDRSSRRDLTLCGLKPETVFPTSVLARLYRREYRAFQPRQIADSVYTRYVHGGRKAAGYARLEHAINAVSAFIHASAGETYSYLYFPEVDAAGHEHGAESDEAWQQVLALDRELERLRAAAGDDVRIVVSADHGQVSVPEADKHVLRDGDELESMLRVWPPAGEPRLPSFHVRPGQRGRFQAAFRERFGDAFVLLSLDEAEALQLYGPAILSPLARARAGDYVAIACGRGAITYAGEPNVHALKGMHGGLLPEEMLVPLVL
ncbi:MAG TPA: alkaline phosphatase family protein, partial [Dehalococcoidia bacterium]|nr:alkaline phosphatase family protein [Dehalococcoidia bacterium]